LCSDRTTVHGFTLCSLFQCLGTFCTFDAINRLDNFCQTVLAVVTGLTFIA
jgi:hypothetical protein